MDTRQAAHTLEVIRTLMERTCQYRLLTAGASLAAGTLAVLGALAFLFLDAAGPVSFAAVWGFVAISLTGLPSMIGMGAMSAFMFWLGTRSFAKARATLA